MTVDWLEDYLTGNEQIDQDHKAIVALCNSLWDDDLDSHDVYQTTKFIVRMVTNHFDDEEILMKASDYSKYKEHCLAHQEIQKVFIGIVKQIKVKNDRLAQLTLISEFVIEYLIDHIKTHDKNLAIYLKGGVS